jgi:hypothetical protein
MKLNNTQKKILLAVLLLLCIPAIEMFDGNSEIKWGPFDFMIAFTLLGLCGLLLEWIIRIAKPRPLKIVILVLVILSFTLLWAELAVGIFDSPIAGD